MSAVVLGNIFRKLDVQTRTQAALFAREMRTNRWLERHIQQQRAAR